MNVWIRTSSRISVPVSVDAVRTVDTLEMVRAVYFVVTSDVPWPDWLPGTPHATGDDTNERVPRLHLLGSAGVVYGPAARGRQFTSPDQLDQVFDMYDRPEDGFTVEVQDVMIPVFWIFDSFKSHDVLRVPLEQFHRAYRYTTGLVTTPDLFIDTYDRDVDTVGISIGEGEVFREWSTSQITEATELYADKDQGLKLESREQLPESWRTDA